MKLIRRTQREWEKAGEEGHRNQQKTFNLMGKLTTEREIEIVDCFGLH